MRLRAPHTADAPFQVIVRCCLGGHGASLGHAVSDLHLGHVHLTDHPLHHLDRASGAGHDSGAKAGQIQFGPFRKVEFGDKHSGHAIEHGGFLLRHRRQSG
ncbi:hypothetical protein D3C71_1604990 [compost metagenome]